MEVEWDPAKAASNIDKHGIGFEEASTCLFDSAALAFEDERAVGESRWILIGLSDRLRLLTVIYTLRERERIRLISARKATRKEMKFYG